MVDIIIPIVFPDYVIVVNTPSVRLNVPNLIPFVDILPNEISVSHTANKMKDLGHAGVLFINGKSGVTKYYEYGRYDPEDKGWVKKVRDLSNLSIDSNGSINKNSLKNILSEISNKAGHGGRISGAYIEIGDKFNGVLEFATHRMSLNNVSDREEYSIFFNSCVHFMKGALEAGGVDTPSIIDPRPNSYIFEIQDYFPSLEYSPKTNSLTINVENNDSGE